MLINCLVAQHKTKRSFAVVEDASVDKPAIQSGTVIDDRVADYAVDGNNSTTDLSKCASSFSYRSRLRVPAWWQVDMGDFYLVKTITVYFPTVGHLG